MHEAATRLSVGMPTIIALVNSKCLKTVLSPHEHGCMIWRICGQSLDELLRQIRSKISPAKDHNLIDIQSYRATISSLRRCGIKVGQFVRDIVDGKIIPCGEDVKEVGIYRLIFEKATVKEYVEGTTKVGGVKQALISMFMMSE